MESFIRVYNASSVYNIQCHCTHIHLPELPATHPVTPRIQKFVNMYATHAYHRQHVCDTCIPSPTWMRRFANVDVVRLFVRFANVDVVRLFVRFVDSFASVKHSMPKQSVKYLVANTSEETRNAPKKETENFQIARADRSTNICMTPINTACWQ